MDKQKLAEGFNKILCDSIVKNYENDYANAKNQQKKQMNCNFSFKILHIKIYQKTLNNNEESTIK